MIAENIIISVVGTIPATINAYGRERTPPPHTVATRLNVATVADDLRNLESCVGFNNSSEACLINMSRSCDRIDGLRRRSSTSSASFTSSSKSSYSSLSSSIMS